MGQHLQILCTKHYLTSIIKILIKKVTKIPQPARGWHQQILCSKILFPVIYNKLKISPASQGMAAANLTFKNIFFWHGNDLKN